jgi:hypothetical protein
VLRNSFHLLVNPYPETEFFVRENFAIAIYTAAAGAVYHFFWASRLVTEKSAGIKHTVPTHFATVKWALGEKFQKPDG